jgi:hypothetical protein
VEENKTRLIFLSTTTDGKFPTGINQLILFFQNHLTKGPKVNPQLLFRCPMCDNPNCGKTKAWLKDIASKA